MRSINALTRDLRKRFFRDEFELKNELTVKETKYI